MTSISAPKFVFGLWSLVVGTSVEAWAVFANDQRPKTNDGLTQSCRERQQRDVARLLDGDGKPPLVRRADAAQAARHDLAAFGHEAREQPHVFVVDGVNFLDAEFANLLAAEIFPAAFAAAAGARTAGTAARAARRPPFAAAA